MGAEKRNLEYLSPDDLIPYANNAKKHPKDQVLRISKSIKEFGFNAPVIIDSKNNIVAGHGRILAAKKLKLETVPCVRVDHLTEKQKKAYILADNRLTELGEWDLEILNTELQDIEYDLDIIGFDGWKVESHLKGLTDEDECPEIPKTPKSKLGDVWILGDHRLMCGDSTDRAAVEKLMLGLKADLLLTDPPYNLAYEGKTKEALKIQNDHMSAAAFKEFLTTVFRNADAVMKKGAAFYIWFADVETLSFLRVDRRCGLDASPDADLDQEHARYGPEGLPFQTRTLPVRLEARSRPLLGWRPETDHAPRIRPSGPQRRASDHEAGGSDRVSDAQQHEGRRCRPRPFCWLRQYGHRRRKERSPRYGDGTRPEILRCGSKKMGRLYGEESRKN